MTFDASTTGPPAMSSPPPGSTLSAPTQLFTWTANGTAVEEWWLEVGTSPGATDIHNSGFIGTATSHTVPGLPTDGSSVDVRLWYKVGGNWTSLDYPYTASGGGSAMDLSNPPHILLAKMGKDRKYGAGTGATYRSHRTLHTLVGVESAASRQGGGIFSLRFGIPQLEPQSVNPLIHLVTHGGSPSTTISPAPQSVLTGSTVTFSWGHVGGTNVPYRYTGKEQDDSTGLYFYEARYYDPVLGRFISADTIVPDPNNPQEFNRYSYVLNNPLKLIDPTGNISSACHSCGQNTFDIDSNYNNTHGTGFDYFSTFSYFPSNQSFNTPFTHGNFQQGLSNASRTRGRSFTRSSIGGAIRGALEFGSSLFPVTNFVTGTYTAVTGRTFFTNEPVSGLDRFGAILPGFRQFRAISKGITSGIGKGRNLLPRGGTYVLRDRRTGHVERSGRSNNLVRRKGEHGRDPNLRGFQFESVHRTDSRAAQRGLEQQLHDQLKPQLNKVNPISPRNPRRNEYLDAAERFLRELGQ